jgi:GT2 family glycosyltransferase
MTFVDAAFKLDHLLTRSPAFEPPSSENRNLCKERNQRENSRAALATIYVSSLLFENKWRSATFQPKAGVLQKKSACINVLRCLIDFHAKEESAIRDQLIRNKMRTKVCAVTIAYNNPGELTRLVESLTSQGSPLRGLIIIDNSDQTYAAENEHVFRLQSRQYEFAHYHKTKNNVGSAGGFRRGMQVAHGNGFDWVWLLDQDGAVSPSCLTELLKHREDGDILCPNLIDIDQPRLSTPFAFLSNFFGELFPATSCSTSCRVCNFGTNAALISRTTLDTIGYYDDSHFFVGWEDLDYGYRAVQAGLVILFVPGALALHPTKGQNSSLKNAAELVTRTPLKHQRRGEYVDPKFGFLDALDARKQKLASRIRRSLPRHLKYVTDVYTKERPCSRAQRSSPFSQAYLECKRLESWQFGAALAYSICCALRRKVAGETEISLTITLRLYLISLAHSLKGDWPYGSVEQLCREILK